MQLAAPKRNKYQPRSRDAEVCHQRKQRCTFAKESHYRHLAARARVGELLSGWKIQRGDDMIGGAFRWWSLADLDDNTLAFHASTKFVDAGTSR